MKVSIKWLSKYVDLHDLTPEMIANKLTFAGIEVEEITHLANASGLVIGEIVTCENHPDSDHLHVLKVNLGEKYGVKQIVCGAPNARKGLKVIVAMVGAKLPEITIKASHIRGVSSEGMCCSLSELGVDKKYLSDRQLAGIEELSDDAIVGNEDVLAYLGLDDTVLDLKLLANRSDCNAMISVAKEVSALFERELHLPEVVHNDHLISSPFKVASLSEKCPQFSIKMIEGIEVKESPLWLKQTLMAMGVRSINNIVDIGNYIMLLTGQPLHMYDLDLLNDCSLSVRDDYEGSFIALDEKEYRLEKGDLVVMNGEHVMCLAGVMGAARCAVTDQTKRIAIEAANFDSASVRRTSIRLNLASESSNRFVKGLNPHQYVSVLEMTARLVEELCGLQKEYQISTYDVVDHHPRLIQTSVARINNRLGTSFSDDEIINVLNRVGIHTKMQDGLLEATIPDHRIDITCDADLSEEVIRIYGFENVRSTLPVLKTTLGGLNEIQAKKRKIRHYLIDNGFDEILTYTLVSHQENLMFNYYYHQEPYRLLHPMSDEHADVRKSLLPSLLKTLQYNVARQARRLAMFETSAMYIDGEEHSHLAIGLYGSDDYQGELTTIAYDFYHMKGVIEGLLSLLGIDEGRYTLVRSDETMKDEFHPGRSAMLFINKEKVAVFGELHPSLAKQYDLDKAPCLVAEILLDKLLEIKTGKKKMQAPNKYPFVERDLALIVRKDIPVSDLIRVIKKNGKSLVKKVMVFDVYEGEHIDRDHKSVAVKITYQSDDHTLEEKEISAAEAEIKAALFKNLAIVLRG